MNFYTISECLDSLAKKNSTIYQDFLYLKQENISTSMPTESPDSLDQAWLSFYMATIISGILRVLEAELTKLPGVREDASVFSDGFEANEFSIDKAGLQETLNKLQILTGISVVRLEQIRRSLLVRFIQYWNDNFQRSMSERTSETSDISPAKETFKARDFFQPLFQFLFCRKLRHAMGEYYTPLWLSRETIADLEYPQRPNERFLDPCCGSGSFLLAAWEALVNRFPAEQENQAAPLLNCLTGYDVNPLAVLQCRANLLLNLLAAARFNPNFETDGIRTSPFWRERQRQLCERIRCEDFLLNSESKSVSDAKSVPVSKSGEFISKPDNSPAAPLSHKSKETFNVAASNPPWIAWDNMPTEYRRVTGPRWKRFGLFSLKGAAARHGGAKKDLASLFFYATADCLERNGRLGMVVPRSLLQTLAGEGFRRWLLPGDRPLSVQQVRDYSRINIFDTAAAKATVISVEADKENNYPVPFYVYSAVNSSLVNSSPESSESGTIRSLSLPSERFSCQTLQAAPSDPNDILSAWSVNSFSATESAAIKTIDGQPIAPLRAKADSNVYQARLGANTGGANGVYWLEILETLERGFVRVKNSPEKSKKEIPQREAVIESDLLFPLVCWKDVQQWRCLNQGRAILIAQNPKTRAGWDRQTMEQKYPNTLEYLLYFQDILESRAAQIRYQKRSEFYSMYNVGEYTFSPWKTVWRRMDSRIRAVAVGPRPLFDLFPRPVFPQETCCFIPTNTPDEAYYLAGVLNSSEANQRAQNSCVAGSKGFGSPRILSFIPLIQYDPNEALHQKIVRLAKAIQKAETENSQTAESTSSELITNLESELNKYAKLLFQE